MEKSHLCWNNHKRNVTCIYLLRGRDAFVVPPAGFMKSLKHVDISSLCHPGCKEIYWQLWDANKSLCIKKRDKLFFHFIYWACSFARDTCKLICPSCSHLQISYWHLKTKITEKERLFRSINHWFNLLIYLFPQENTVPTWCNITGNVFLTCFPVKPWHISLVCLPIKRLLLVLL